MRFAEWSLLLSLVILLSRWVQRITTRPAARIKGPVHVASRTMGDEARYLPKKFERHGHVIVVQTNEGVTTDQLRSVSESFAATFKPAVHVIVADVGGITGELRQPLHEILWLNKHPAEVEVAAILARGAKNTSCEFPPLSFSPTLTTHVENGVKYTFDVMRVMFSSGNTTERLHFASVDAADQLVVDMFAGIGYFALPLAMHGRAAHIFAMEKNPESAAFLQFNAMQNGVSNTINIYCGDNREVTENQLCGKCDRVLMGYIPDCKMFLPRATSFLKCPQGNPVGVVHYHYLCEKAGAYKKAFNDVVETLGEEIVGHFEVTQVRQVKSYSSKKYHYVADLTFEPKMFANTSMIVCFMLL